jgi:hypothetical protein
VRVRESRPGGGVEEFVQAGCPMADPQTLKLRETIREVVGKIQKYQDRNLGEENTKASLIEPVLEGPGLGHPGPRRGPPGVQTDDSRQAG